MPHPNLHPNPALEARLARRGPLSLSKWGGVSLQSLLSPVGRNNHALSANATQWRARRGRNGWRRIGSSQARFMRPPEQIDASLKHATTAGAKQQTNFPTAEAKQPTNVYGG